MCSEISRPSMQYWLGSLFVLPSCGDTGTDRYDHQHLGESFKGSWELISSWPMNVITVKSGGESMYTTIQKFGGHLVLFCVFWFHIHCLAKKKFRFQLANCSVMIWGCFSWSGLGTASQQSSWMYWMTRLSHQWIFFFPDGSGIFQDDNAKIHRARVVEEWNMNTHKCQGAKGVIFTHELATTESWLYPIKSLWDVLEKTEGMVWLINIKSWPKINATVIDPKSKQKAIQQNISVQ